MEVKKNRYFYPDTVSMKTHELCATMIPFNLKRKRFSDLTGAFPQKASRGYLYVLVMYDYNRNTILAVPFKNKKAENIRDAFLRVHKVLKARVNDPQIYIIDNKCSSDLKKL